MKKFTCTFLSLLMILSLAFVSVCADDNPATVGYSAALVDEVDLTKVVDITSIETTDAARDLPAQVKISDAAGMQRFASLVNTTTENTDNTFNGKTVYLEKDIDMSGVTEWTPIANNTGAIVGNNAKPYFQGTFDGQGHSIKNLVVTSDATGTVNIAIFGRLQGATIKNLVIAESCSFTYTGGSKDARTASLAASIFCNGANGKNTIQNVCNHACVTANGGFVGGLFAAAGGNNNSAPGVINTITNCTNTGAVTATGTFDLPAGWSTSATADAAAAAGGFAGHCSRGWLKFSYCLNTGAVTAAGNAGGFIPGRSVCGDELYIEYCRNNGNVTGAFAGGLMGYATGGNDNIFYSTNTGKIETSSATGEAKQHYANSSANVSRGYNTEAVDTVKVLGYQKALDVTTKEGSDTTYRSVRLVGVFATEPEADLSKYDLVGLEIIATYTVNGVTFTKALSGSSQTVYTSLAGMENVENNGSFEKQDNEYYFAIVLKDMPTTIGNVKLSITPYYEFTEESGTIITYGLTTSTAVDIATAD